MNHHVENRAPSSALAPAPQRTARVAGEPKVGLPPAVQRERASQLGHHLRSAPARAASHGEAPIQRAIDPNRVLSERGRTWGKKTESMRRRILAAIENHNQAQQDSSGTQADIHAQMKHLDEIEHLAYGWFRHSQQDERDPNRAGMFDLLDQVQQHHKEMVRQTVAGGHELWVHGDVNDSQRRHINKLWSEVTDPTRNTRFRYATQTQTGGLGGVDMPQSFSAHLQEEGNANMARLLSRPKGRQLVSHLHRRAGAVGQPVLLTTANPVDMLGDPDDPRAPINPILSPSAQTPNIPPQELHHTGGNRRAKQTKPGDGVPFGLKMMPGIKDSDFSDYNAQGKRVPSPVFVGFGHELTHGAHYMSGTFLPGAEMSDLPANYKGDIEEFRTIAPKKDQAKLARSKVRRKAMHREQGGNRDVSFDFAEMLAHDRNIPNEADIREEHGLPLRHGHTSSLTPEMHPGARGGDDEVRDVGWQHITEPRRIARQLYADVGDETPAQLRERQARNAAAAAAAARPWWKRLLGWD